MDDAGASGKGVRDIGGAAFGASLPAESVRTDEKIVSTGLEMERGHCPWTCTGDSAYRKEFPIPVFPVLGGEDDADI